MTKERKHRTEWHRFRGPSPQLQFREDQEPISHCLGLPKWPMSWPHLLPPFLFFSFLLITRIRHIFYLDQSYLSVLSTVTVLYISTSFPAGFYGISPISSEASFSAEPAYGRSTFQILCLQNWILPLFNNSVVGILRCIHSFYLRGGV